jgi:hypothetical protein
LEEHEMAHPEGLAALLDETNQLIGIFAVSLKTLRRAVDGA